MFWCVLVHWTKSCHANSYSWGCPVWVRRNESRARRALTRINAHFHFLRRSRKNTSINRSDQINQSESVQHVEKEKFARMRSSMISKLFSVIPKRFRNDSETTQSRRLEKSTNIYGKAEPNSRWKNLTQEPEFIILIVLYSIVLYRESIEFDSIRFDSTRLHWIKWDWIVLCWIVSSHMSLVDFLSSPLSPRP